MGNGRPSAIEFGKLEDITEIQNLSDDEDSQDAERMYKTSQSNSPTSLTSPCSDEKNKKTIEEAKKNLITSVRKNEDISSLIHTFNEKFSEDEKSEIINYVD